MIREIGRMMEYKIPLKYGRMTERVMRGHYNGDRSGWTITICSMKGGQVFEGDGDTLMEEGK